MDIAIIAGCLSALAALIGIYFQFFKKGKIECVKPSNCLLGPIQDFGVGIIIPLSLHNAGSKPVAIERFSLLLTRRVSGEKMAGGPQVGLQWYTCSRLSSDTDVQLGSSITVFGKNTCDLVVGFTSIDGWHFEKGHSQVLVLAHTKENQEGIKMCQFDIHLNENDLDRIKERQHISFFQRWFGKEDSHNVLIPSDRGKQLGEFSPQNSLEKDLTK